MGRRVIIFFVFVCFFKYSLVAQKLGVRDLLKKVETENTDSQKINLYNAIASEYKNSFPDTAIFFANKALLISTKNNLEIKIANSCFELGEANSSLGNFTTAIDFFNKANVIFLKLKKPKNIGDAFNALGWVYFGSGNNSEGLKYLKIALKIREALKNTKDIAITNKNIAVVFQVQGNYPEALKKYFIVLKSNLTGEDEETVARVYNNMAMIYRDMEDYQKSIESAEKSLKICLKNSYLDVATACYLNLSFSFTKLNNTTEALINAKKAYETAIKTNNPSQISGSLSQISQVYSQQGKYDLALEKYFEGLKFIDSTKSAYDLAFHYKDIALIYYQKKEYETSIFYSKKALSLFSKEQYLSLYIEIIKISKDAYIKTKHYQKALELQNTYYSLRDSVYNQKSRKELIKQEIKYSYDKQSLADSLKYDSEKKLTDFKNQEVLKKEQYKLIVLSVGLLVALALGLFVFNRFKITQKQNKIIALQKQKIETKTKEIQDSIDYSKEIQNIFLKWPNDHTLFLQSAHLIYKPKDVVSGDFYWHKKINANLFIVVGDCTGHGVPGAIISVLAIQSLEKHISSISNPNKLHELSFLLREEFNTYYQKESRVSIGLDYSILCINSEDKKIYVSGSSSTALLKKASGMVVAERFDSINIGGTIPVIYNPKTMVYPTQEIKSVYLYTDGIIDQKGGSERKKFGTKQFIKTIENEATNKTSIDAISQALENWKGDEVQIDDITVLELILAT